MKLGYWFHLSTNIQSQIYQNATSEFSQTKVPTISKVLPLFKAIQQHLQNVLKDPDLVKDKSGQKYWGLKSGLKAGLAKIDIHLKKALMGDYPLLGAHEFSQFPFLPSWFSGSTLVLHPLIQLSYFKDKSKWDPSIPLHVHILLEHLYEIYKEDGPVSDTAAPQAQKTTPSVFMDAIKIVAPSLSRAVMEIEAFFSGTYPCTNGYALKWWKVCALILQLLSNF